MKTLFALVVLAMTLPAANLFAETQKAQPSVEVYQPAKTETPATFNDDELLARLD